MESVWASWQKRHPTYRSVQWYPNSPSTIPFRRNEVWAMEDRGIDWKTYLPGLKPAIPADELKQKLKISPSKTK